jgi:hypothetical protein
VKLKWSITLPSLGHLQLPQGERETGDCSAEAQPGFVRTILRLLVIEIIAGRPLTFTIQNWVFTRLPAKPRYFIIQADNPDDRDLPANIWIAGYWFDPEETGVRSNSD